MSQNQNSHKDIIAVSKSKREGFKQINYTVETLDGTEKKFQYLTRHSIDKRPTPVGKYKFNDIITDENGILQSTPETSIVKYSDSKTIDREIIYIFERIDKKENSYTDWYRALTSENIECELRLIQRYGVYDTDISDLAGLYLIEEFELIETYNKKYLQGTQSSSIGRPPNDVFDLDLFVVGDAHIGYRDPSLVNQNTRHTLRDDFEHLIDTALNEDIDAIIALGDLFELRKPRQGTVRWVKNQITRLQASDIGFAFIQGNHDPANLSDRLTELKNVVYFGDGAIENQFGFRFRGYDHDKLSIMDEIELSENKNELIFIHPADTNCKSLSLSKISNQEISKSFIFAGHCHTAGKCCVRDTDVIFPGALASELNNRNHSSALRVKLCNGQLAAVNTFRRGSQHFRDLLS